MAYRGSLSEQMEGVEQLADPAIRRVEVVLSDVLPYLVEIKLAATLRTYRFMR
jgi:hypothetical protein